MPIARTSVAKRYAEAVFELAKAHNSFDRWLTELEAIARVQEQPELSRLLANPAVSMSEKESLLAEFLPGISPEGRNLIKLLLRKGRFRLASQIEEHYRAMLNEHRGIATAQVLSAIPLGAEEIKAVARRLSELTGRKIVVQPAVDPSIIGGIVARVGDQLIDASVRGRLEALKRRLASA